MQEVRLAVVDPVRKSGGLLLGRYEKVTVYQIRTSNFYIELDMKL